MMLTIQSPYSIASVSILSTRVIYPESKSEVTINTINKGKSPHLLQAWIEDNKGSKEKIPFIIIPPVTRIDPGEGQVYRIIKTDDVYPNDQESIFWLNFLDIPPKAKGSEKNNSMQFAIKTKIKLFYRPDEISDKTPDIKNNIVWKKVKKSDNGLFLVCVNNSPFNFSFSSLYINEKNSDAFFNGGMCLANQNNEFKINDHFNNYESIKKINVSYINDYGGLSNVIMDISE